MILFIIIIQDYTSLFLIIWENKIYMNFIMK